MRPLPLLLILAVAVAGSAANAEPSVDTPATRADEPAPAKETGTITGKIVDAQGKPVKDAFVAAMIGGPNVLSLPIRQRNAKLSQTTSGDDGSFKLENVPAGKVLIGVIEKSIGVYKSPNDIDVTAGKDTSLGDLTLKDDRPPASRPG